MHQNTGCVCVVCVAPLHPRGLHVPATAPSGTHGQTDVRRDRSGAECSAYAVRLCMAGFVGPHPMMFIIASWCSSISSITLRITSSCAVRARGRCHTTHHGWVRAVFSQSNGGNEATAHPIQQESPGLPVTNGRSATTKVKCEVGHPHSADGSAVKPEPGDAGKAVRDGAARTLNTGSPSGSILATSLTRSTEVLPNTAIASGLGATHDRYTVDPPAETPTHQVASSSATLAHSRRGETGQPSTQRAPDG